MRLKARELRDTPRCFPAPNFCDFAGKGLEVKCLSFKFLIVQSAFARKGKPRKPGGEAVFSTRANSKGMK